MIRIFTFSISVKRSLALLSVVFALGVARLSAQTYLPAPYYNGFETGSLGTEWTTFSSQPGTNIEVIQSGTLVWNTEVAMAYAGNYFLGMDFGTGGTYNLNQANLHLNLAGASNLRFEFQWAEWNDETEPQDGIFISDDGGANYVKVLDLNGASYTDLTYTHFDMSLDSINTVHGLTFSAQYIIRLQQYDNYYFAGGNDGFLFDELRVYSTCVSTSSSISPLSCDSYTAPDGAVYTTGGSYTATINNSAGCDSVITINLTLNHSTTATINTTALDSYTVPSGTATYTASGTYNDTIPNAVGCDSVLVINVTMTFTGVDEISNQWLSGYPNPVTDVFQVNGMDELRAVQSIYVLNIQGQVVRSYSPNERLFKMDELVAGTYFFIIEHESGLSRVLFVKQ